MLLKIGGELFEKVMSVLCSQLVSAVLKRLEKSVIAGLIFLHSRVQICV